MGKDSGECRDVCPKTMSIAMLSALSTKQEEQEGAREWKPGKE